MRKWFIGTLAIALCAVTPAAFAQFGGLGKGSPLGGKQGGQATAPAGGKAGVSKDAVLQKQTEALKGYAEARRSFDKADYAALRALELNKEAEAFMSKAEYDSTGPVSTDGKGMDRERVLSPEAKKAHEEKMAKTSSLTEEGKKWMGQSLKHLTAGLLQEQTLLAVVTAASQDAQTVITGASVLDKPAAIQSFKPIVELAASLPGDLQSAGSTLGKYIQFCQKVGVPTKDAEEATKSMAKKPAK